MYSYLESVFCPLFILVVTPIDKGGSNMWTRRLTSPLPHPHTPHPLIQPIAAVGPIEQPRTINRHVPVYIIATRLHTYILEQQIYLFIYLLRNKSFLNKTPRSNPMDQTWSDSQSYYTRQLLQLQASCSIIQVPSGSGPLQVNFMQHAGLWGQLGSPTQQWHGAHTILTWIVLSGKWANGDGTGLRAVKPSYSAAPVCHIYIFFRYKYWNQDN